MTRAPTTTYNGTVMMPVQNQIVTEEFYEVRKLIWKLSKGMHYHIGETIPLEDLFGAACIGFMEAYNTFEPHRGHQFTGWVYWKVMSQLRDYVRKEIKHRQKLKDYAEHKENSSISSSSNPEHAIDIIDQLSDNAKCIAKLVIDMPNDLARAMRADTKYCSGHHIKTGLRQYLLGIGWENHTISQSFNEIKEALRC